VHGEAALLAHGALLEQAEDELAAVATMSRPFERCDLELVADVDVERFVDCDGAGIRRCRRDCAVLTGREDLLDAAVVARHRAVLAQKALLGGEAPDELLAVAAIRRLAEVVALERVAQMMVLRILVFDRAAMPLQLRPLTPFHRICSVDTGVMSTD